MLRPFNYGGALLLALSLPPGDVKKAVEDVYDTFIWGGGEQTVEKLVTAESRMKAMESFVDHLQANILVVKNEVGPSYLSRLQKLSQQMNATFLQALGQHLEDAPERRVSGSKHSLNAKPAHPPNEEEAKGDSLVDGEIVELEVEEDEESLVEEEEKWDSAKVEPAPSPPKRAKMTSKKTSKKVTPLVDQVEEKTALSPHPKRAKKVTPLVDKVEEKTPVEILHILTRKSVTGDDVKACFRCKNSVGCSWNARVQKLNPRQRSGEKKQRCEDPIELWQAYEDIARIFDNTGLITKELRSYVLCGNCASKGTVSVKMTELPDDYLELAQLFGYQPSKDVLTKLRAAADMRSTGSRSKRARRSARLFLKAKPQNTMCFCPAFSEKAYRSSHHSFSLRICSSSSGVKSFLILNVLRISSGVFPLIMFAMVLQVRSNKLLTSR